ncbi:MFS transporter [Roseomonas gilardii]|uniref:MFS transporter n=1 Tax=Roseomonas gilardii TaxID=257708 RepID=UPI0011A75179|nr:MFS transporter [Roseomonas gilardii]
MWKKRRHLAVFLLFLAGIINYMDRSALSIAAPAVSGDLGLSPSEMGLVFSSFFFGYAIFNFIGGLISDKAGPYRVFSLSMGVWSVFCGLTGLAGGFVSMLLIRIGFGVGEGPFSASANKMVSNWFPRREAGTAIGIANGGTPLGGAIAGPLVGFTVLHFGWRVSFFVVAVIGLVWLVFWLALMSNSPEGDPRVSEEERREIAGDQPDALPSHVSPPGLGAQLRKPAVLATAFAFFGYNYILYFFLTWFPSYLTMARGLSLHDMSLVTVIPWILGCIGLIGGGFLTDVIYRRTGNALFSRKIVLVVCLGIAAVAIMVAGTMTTVTGAVALTAITICALYLTGSTYWTIVQDAVPREYVGATGGFVHGLANIAGIIGPAVTGFIVQSTGSFTSAFVLAGSIAVLGVIAVTVLVRAPRETAAVTQSRATLG